MKSGIAELIDAWIAAKPGRSNTTLALAAGLHRSYIWRLRKGDRAGFRPETMGALSQGLGVPLEVVAEAADVRLPTLPTITFREFIDRDARLNTKQKRDLLHTYYETFGIKDASTAPLAGRSSSGSPGAPPASDGSER